MTLSSHNSGALRKERRSYHLRYVPLARVARATSLFSRTYSSGYNVRKRCNLSLKTGSFDRSG
jgi:hypothetical protein